MDVFDGYEYYVRYRHTSYTVFVLISPDLAGYHNPVSQKLAIGNSLTSQLLAFINCKCFIVSESVFSGAYGMTM